MKNYLFVYLICALLIASGQAVGQICDLHIVKTKPDSQYELLNDGTEVKDKKTGLIWQRCPLGMGWDGTTCSGTASLLTWEGALAQAASVAHTTGVAWRLPNIKELVSLREWACVGPDINETFFPGIQIPNSSFASFWSSTTYAGESTGSGKPGQQAVWTTHYDDWWQDAVGKSSSISVRLVRGE